METIDEFNLFHCSEQSSDTWSWLIPAVYPKIFGLPPIP